MPIQKVLCATALTSWPNDNAVLDSRQLLDSTYRPVVVLDSGVGGLTLVRQLEQLAPEVSILYVADNGWFPYGSKSVATVACRVQQLLDQVCTRVDPLAVVIACNTASIALIDHGRVPFTKEYFLVTPPLEEAVRASANGKIALLATLGTIKSKYISTTLAKARTRAQIWPIAAQRLVELSEYKLAGQTTSLACFSELIDSHLTTDQRLEIDTVILGCTHFPHLLGDLKTLFPSAAKWIDPAKEVALQIASSIKINISTLAPPPRTVIFTSMPGTRNSQHAFSNYGFHAAYSFLT
ncbi:glutamate racemase [Pseudomonas sp. NPDC089428]|uniref:glutamate racemase n=1 Tax=Pseudomonas sp. NPDC089428 TaxID=3364467 RepID=UPI00381DBCFB